MTSTASQQISKEDIKQVIISLIQENNAEFTHLIADLMPKIQIPSKKKSKKKVESTFVQNERIPYSEMPFWKTHSHLKPLVAEDFGAEAVSMETIKNLQTLFQQPDCPPIEEWLADLD